ncbi:hypothetical protein LY90DRAFT_511992 [Neocallimastix californiae]|uniref:Gfd2/YDR514C-like C-terminal domain-containing protein n=1 Tax=Neocallimastix californiae TaxID=1754190 RepID=A0A1Y2BFQ4_9FUNG|nr:hypothetical protein LY90DRAFT_511992 [Neocallimastix californiae]|eukprot:ORY33639.1 hypothetical protein LY90DRAFT_511992 [Neocallimastix californiae]
MDCLKYNIDIPKYIIKESSLETCHNLIRLQNNIKCIDIINKKISSTKLFLSLDTESYEKNHNYLTEVGWIIFNKNGEIKEKKHYIVQEYLSLRNGKYVDDNKFNYNFGESITRPLNEIKLILKMNLDRVNYIVGQGIKNDICDLKKINIDLSKFKEMNDTLETYGIIDTQDLYAANFFESPVSLKKGLDKFFISYRNLHNAGNDAYYTMKYFLALLRNFEFSDSKIQNLLKIKIPDDYNENDYIRYSEEKKLLKKQEKKLKKLSKIKRNNYRNNFYDDYADIFL